MPSIELNKLQGISGARALSESDRAPQASPGSLNRTEAGTGKPGVTLELGTGLDAAEPPVDADRVSQIRDALRDGTYPLIPTRIADAIIAARVGPTIPS